MIRDSGHGEAVSRIERLMTLLEETSRSISGAPDSSSSADGLARDAARVLLGRLLFALATERHEALLRIGQAQTSLEALLEQPNKRPGQVLLHFQGVVRGRGPLSLPDQALQRKVGVVDQMTQFSSHELLEEWDGLIASTAREILSELDQGQHFDAVLDLPTEPEEVLAAEIRPALKALFRRCWEEADGDVERYEEALLELRILDGRVGASQRLRAVALELALEVAFVRRTKRRRSESCYDVDVEDTHVTTLAEVEPVWQADFEASLGPILTDVMHRCTYGVGREKIETKSSKLAFWLDGLYRSGAARATFADLFCIDVNVLWGDMDRSMDWSQALAIIAGRTGDVGIDPGAMLFSTKKSFLEKNAYVAELHERLRRPSLELIEWVWGTGRDDEDGPSLSMLPGLRQTLIDDARKVQANYDWVYAWAHLLEEYGVAPGASAPWTRLMGDLTSQGAQFGAQDDREGLFREMMRCPLKETPEAIRRLREAITRLATARAAQGAVGAPVLFRELAYPQLFPIGKHRGFDLVL